MSERISIPELLASDCVAVPAWKVVALVEAVEAAHAQLKAGERISQNLGVALLRFSFEGVSPLSSQ